MKKVKVEGSGRIFDEGGIFSSKTVLKRIGSRGMLPAVMMADEVSTGWHCSAKHSGPAGELRKRTWHATQPGNVSAIGPAAIPQQPQTTRQISEAISIRSVPQISHVTRHFRRSRVPGFRFSAE